MVMRITEKQKSYVKEVAQKSVDNQLFYNGKALPLDEFFSMALRDATFWNVHFRRNDVTEENVAVLNRLLATYYSEALLRHAKEPSTQRLLTDEELDAFFEGLIKKWRSAAS